MFFFYFVKNLINCFLLNKNRINFQLLNVHFKNQIYMKRIVLIYVSFLFVLGTAWAQRTVSGIVTSDDGSGGIPGVNVILKGSTTGTTTDLDGNYRLSVPEEGGTLEFSFIGLSTQEVVIGARSVIDITKSEDVETLGEVVVTALGVELSLIHI